MTSNRRFSRKGHDVKLARRPDLEAAIEKAVESIITDHDPTAHMPAVRSAAKLAGVVASRLATQKQVVQRALKVVEPRIEAMGVRFVNDVVASATGGVQAAVEKFQASAPPTDDVPELDITAGWAGELAGPSFIERHFGIPRSTLYRWQKRDEVIAIQSRTSRKPVFPLRQFRNGRPIDGIPELIQIFGDAAKAWQWAVASMIAPLGMAPIEALLAGCTDDVLRSATAAAKPETSPQ
jgi:hypothetical protein